MIKQQTTQFKGQQKPTNSTQKQGTQKQATQQYPLSPNAEKKLTTQTRETLEKILRLRSIAQKSGLRNAVKALDHYLGGTGAFVEIPQSKVDSVRQEAEKQHIETIIKLLVTQHRAATKLAATGLVESGGKAKPEKLWPKKITFQLEYESGVERSGVNDDNLTYYGSAIHSEMTVEGNLVPGTRCYELQFAKWRAWVVDNYDWEGEKQFGGSLFSGIIPSQADMRRLETVGVAKAYQRSSKSWTIAQKQKWKECFDTDEMVAGYAKVRRDIDNANQLNRKQNAADGALPTPPPAEEVQRQKTGDFIKPKSGLA